MSDQQHRAAADRPPIEKLLRYIGILRRYKWLVIVSTVLAAAGSVGFSILTLRLPIDVTPLPNIYIASATILIQSDESRGLSASSLLSSLGFSAPGVGIDYGEVVQRVLRSRPFIDTVVREFDIIARYGIVESPRTNSRAAVLGSMAVDFDARSRFLSIAYRDTDPIFAAEVANRIVSLLEDWFSQSSGSSKQRQIAELEEKLIEVEESIEQLEPRIVTRQQEMGVLRVEEIADVQAAMLTDLQSRLVQLQIEIRNYEQRARIEDAGLADLRAQQANLKQLIQEVEAGYTGGDKTMPARDELPHLALELTRLHAELGVQMRIFETLSQQYEVTRLAAQAEPVMTILEAAEVPEQKSGPSRGRLCIMVTFGAFFGSIALAFVIHGLRGLLRDPEKMKLLRSDGESM